MRRGTWMPQALIGLAGTLLLSAAPAPARADAKDANELRGEWTLVRHVKPDGTVIRHDGALGNSHFVLRFAGAKVVQEYDFGDPSLEITMEVALDPSVTPKRIDLTVTDASKATVADELKGKVQRGVYRIDGERLTLCLAEFREKARPAGFDPGRGRDVFELKRVKR